MGLTPLPLFRCGFYFGNSFYTFPVKVGNRVFLARNVVMNFKYIDLIRIYDSHTKHSYKDNNIISRHCWYNNNENRHGYLVRWLRNHLGYPYPMLKWLGLHFCSGPHSSPLLMHTLGGSSLNFQPGSALAFWAIWGVILQMQTLYNSHSHFLPLYLN